MDTDACEFQVRSALFQPKENGDRKQVGFWSRTLNKAYRNYSSTENECLAVINGISTCRNYVLGEQFDDHTDHSCLRWLIEIFDTSGCIMRWIIQLSEYDFVIHHKKGILNTQEYAFSRLTSNKYTFSILKKQCTEEGCERLVQRPMCAGRLAVAPRVAYGRARSGHSRVISADATR